MHSSSEPAPGPARVRRWRRIPSPRGYASRLVALDAAPGVLASPRAPRTKHAPRSTVSPPFHLPRLAQERFAKKNEAEDLRRAFEKLDKKGCVHPRRARDRPPRPARVIFTHPPPPHTYAPPGATRRDGKIDPEELGSVFQELKHRIKKVPALARSPPLRDPSIVALPTDATPA